MLTNLIAWIINQWIALAIGLVVAWCFVPRPEWLHRRVNDGWTWVVSKVPLLGRLVKPLP